MVTFSEVEMELDPNSHPLEDVSRLDEEENEWVIKTTMLGYLLTCVFLVLYRTLCMR